MSRLQDITNVAALGYTFGPLIGKGSYAKVFRAKYYDPSLNEGTAIDLACKYIVRKKCPEDFLTKFVPRELEILKKISHPFIIKTHSIMETETSIFIFMRYAEKGDLLDYVKKNGAVKEKIANVWFYQMVSAINYLHSLGIAHRDLKCENILVTKNMNLHVSDFGFARYTLNVENLFTDEEIIVFSDTYCGSAAYAPPEVVSGTPYDIMKVDIWSLGIILLILLNGIMPFDDSNITKLIADQRSRTYRINPDKMKDVSNYCQFVINGCIEPDPAVRWDSYTLLNTPWIRPQLEKYNKKN